MFHLFMKRCNNFNTFILLSINEQHELVWISHRDFGALINYVYDLVIVSSWMRKNNIQNNFQINYEVD